MSEQEASGGVAPTADRAVGCLLGGAVGDALGAGIEFASWDEIAAGHGPAGVTGYVPAYGRRGAITDDTQMTLFTAEGLIRAAAADPADGSPTARDAVRLAYLRWRWTQGDGRPLGKATGHDRHAGGLADLPELHSRRAPGTTCLSALSAGGDGTIEHPANRSKGCGGVMRAAPVGFVPGTSERRFRLGCEVAALTHGHPSGYLPAGYLALAVGAIAAGGDVPGALDAADEVLRTWPGSAETIAAVAAGRELGRQQLPTADGLHSLGGGWTGEEALAIALACVESGPTFEAGVLAAVNHSGDSDSTGSIVGNLLGARDGRAGIPARWLDELELRDEIERVARRLVDATRAGG